jgi:uncharacterized protein YdhG (YjbR/CyaY superfamily)
VTSNAATVDEYLAELPEDRQEALIRIRALCRDRLKGFTEDMRYGMPSYSRNEVVEVAFASQKQAISLYVLRTGVLDQYRGRFARSAIGKGCIRYKDPGQIDFEMVAEMLEKTVADAGAVC